MISKVSQITNVSLRNIITKGKQTTQLRAQLLMATVVLDLCQHLCRLRKLLSMFYLDEMLKEG